MKQTYSQITCGRWCASGVPCFLVREVFDNFHPQILRGTRSALIQDFGQCRKESCGQAGQVTAIKQREINTLMRSRLGMQVFGIC